MNQAAELDRPLDELSQLPAAQRSMSNVLYGILVSTMRGKALTIARKGNRGWGLELWRQLVSEFESSAGPRVTAMLVGVLNPSWDAGRPFLDQLAEWEVQVDRYESLSNEKITPAVKAAVLVSNAPADIRATLRVHLATASGDFDRLRSLLSIMMSTEAVYDASGARAGANSSHNPRDPNSMDIGAIKRKDKGKGKGK